MELGEETQSLLKMPSPMWKAAWRFWRHVGGVVGEGAAVDHFVDSCGTTGAALEGLRLREVGGRLGNPVDSGSLVFGSERRRREASAKERDCDGEARGYRERGFQ